MLALHRVFFGDAQDLRVVLRTWSCPAKDPEVGPLPMTVSVTFWVSFFQQLEPNQREKYQDEFNKVCVYIYNILY